MRLEVLRRLSPQLPLLSPNLTSPPEGLDKVVVPFLAAGDGSDYTHSCLYKSMLLELFINNVEARYPGAGSWVED